MMAIKWIKSADYNYGDGQYDAKIGPLFARVQDNGEGWFNWSVSTEDMGIANEEGPGTFAEGGAPSRGGAKRSVLAAVRKFIRSIVEGL